MADAAPTKWERFGKYTGFQTLYDPTKVDDGANPGGQNTSVNEGDRISSRPYGYESFATPVATTTDYGGQAQTTAMHTFRKRNGENIMMRSLFTTTWGTIIQYLDSSTLEWQNLTYGYNAIPFGFTDYNITSDQSSLVFFCNGFTNLQIWTGAHANFASASNTAGFIGTIGAIPSGTGNLGTESGYVSGDIVTIAGGTATAEITGVANGGIATYTLVNGGTGYGAGNTILINNGTGEQNGLFVVDTVDGSGTILTLHKTGRGTDYVEGVSYTDIGAGNHDAQIRVDTVYNGYVTTVVIATNASGYTTGVKATTGGTGTGFTVDITGLAQNTITISQTATLATLGFISSSTIGVGDRSDPVDPTKVVFYSYTGISGNIFYGVSPDPTLAGHTAGAGVFQRTGIDPTTATSAARGNILMTASNRLFVSGDPRNFQIVYFSQYGDPTTIGSTTLVSSATATSPGIFNLAEGGGPVTGMVLQEQSIYFLKQNIIYQATLSDSFYTITPLKPFDQISKSAGALYGTVFTGSNRVFMSTADNQILGLERIEQIDYPQLTPISYPILPTVSSYDIRRLRGIVFNNRAFMALGSQGTRGAASSIDPNVPTVGTSNDRVLVWNVNTKTFDAPIVGWNVGAWTIYDDGTGDQVYFGSDVDPNVYRVTSTPTDGDFPVTTLWPSKRYDFGMPAQQKWCPNFFVYGRILPNTVLTVSVLFNEEGSTQTYTGSFSGTDTAKLFGRTSNNSFGENPFGVEVFGDQSDTTGMRYFRVYFVNKVRAVPFYNIQIAFSSEGINQQWQVLEYAFKVGLYQNEENRNLYSDFSPAST